MTSTSNLADVVRHYQRSIERHGEDETRLLHCITKLFNLPITFEHLQETGIGKTVNALRKINGDVGVAAKTLVTKWKAMVAAEEEPTANSNCNEDDANRRSSEEDQDQENKGSNSSSGEETRHKKKHEKRSGNNDEHKTKSSTVSRSSSHKSHSKSRTESDKRHKSSTHDKVKAKESDSDRHHKDSDRHRKEQHKSSSSSISEHRKPKESPKPSSHHHKSSSDSSKKRHSSSHKSDHSKSTHEKSKEDKTQYSEQKDDKKKSDKHKSSSSSSKSSSTKRIRSPARAGKESPKAKISKTKSKAEHVEENEEETVNEFDSTTGANFDDVLGMLNMPTSGRKMANKVRSPTKPATKTLSTSSSSSSRRTTATTSSSGGSSTGPTTKKPELLAPSAKLEPLDPSIALELPTISNNYKPLPLNQTVMDVVFNHGLGNSAHRASRNYNESEALAAGISSKTMRTKIYSGVRTGQILQVPSLFDLCTRVLQKNIDALEYTGGVPFDVLRSVLERATPHQLLVFEEYNPYLMEDSEVLWQQHVQRHCRSQRREEMETWREMFLRCEEEKERKLSVISESIKAAQKISEAPVRKTQLAFVDSMVKPPRSVMRKQEQYGTKGKLIATPAARVAALSNLTPNAAKVGDARLRVIGMGRDAAQVAAPVRNKKAPLMAKALQLIRGRHKR